MPDYFEYTYPEMKTLCRERGLLSCGKKLELVDRLEEYWIQQASENQQAGENQQTMDSTNTITTTIIPWAGEEQDPTLLQRLPNIDPPPEFIMRNGYGWNPIRLVGKFITSYILGSQPSTLTLDFIDSTTVTIRGGTTLTSTIPGSITIFPNGSIHVDDSLSFALEKLSCGLYGDCLEIVDAALGKRITEITKYVKRHGSKKWEESHVVLGLRLDGMEEMGWMEFRDGENERWWPQYDDIWLGEIVERIMVE